MLDYASGISSVIDLNQQVSYSNDMYTWRTGFYVGVLPTQKLFLVSCEEPSSNDEDEPTTVVRCKYIRLVHIVDGTQHPNHEPSCFKPLELGDHVSVSNGDGLWYPGFLYVKTLWVGDKCTHIVCPVNTREYCSWKYIKRCPTVSTEETNDTFIYDIRKINIGDEIEVSKDRMIWLQGFIAVGFSSDGLPRAERIADGRHESWPFIRKRVRVKEVTIEEIEKKFGHKVKIVGGSK